MSMTRSRPYAGLLKAAAALTVALVTAVAMAAPTHAAKGGGAPKPPKPVRVSVSTVVAGSDVTVAVKVGTASSRITSVTCELDGASFDCPLVEATKNRSLFSAALTGLADGDHLVSASALLGDGTIASGSAAFTVDTGQEPPPPTDPAGICEGLGGSYYFGILAWTCTYPSGSDTADPLLVTACTTDATTTGADVGGVPSVIFECSQASALTAQTACTSAGGTWFAPAEARFGYGEDSWQCAASETPELEQALSVACAAVSGFLIGYIGGDGRGSICVRA